MTDPVSVTQESDDPKGPAMTDQSGGHTLGPWLLAEGNCSALVYALDETGGVNRFSARVDGGYSYCGRTVKERTTEEEVLANARLIAAAPNLLAALQALLAECDPGDGAIYCPGDLEPARAAITLATGAAS